MLLILMRHGLAVERSSQGEDAFRPLVMKGEKRTQKVIRAVKEHIPVTTQIWCSPYVRTEQTAAIVADELGVFEVHKSHHLIAGDYDAFMEDLGTDEESVMVVGHEPWLSEWVYGLCGVSLQFKKSGLVFIQYEGKNSGKIHSLLGYVSPKMIKD